MKKTTLKKIIKVNCRMTGNSKLFKNYENIIDNISPLYKLSIGKLLSISNTPVVYVRNKKINLPAACLWCYDDFYYLKTPIKIYIAEKIETVKDFINDYFYAGFSNRDIIIQHEEEF